MRADCKSARAAVKCHIAFGLTSFNFFNFLNFLNFLNFFSYYNNGFFHYCIFHAFLICQ